MSYHLITLSCVLAAIICYVAGFGTGSGIFFAIGLFFEAALCVRLRRGRKFFIPSS
ncbi:MAG: hypothetical protein JWM78_2327 [Verrucomicrobiaceae bacterium]|nr:hypothetical protein [Verrucomicrobiaceae bacterium]